MIELPRTFRAPWWVVGTIVVGLGVSTIGFCFFRQMADETVKTWGFAGLGLLFAAGLLESLVTRVVLTREALEVKKFFKTTRLLPAQVERVVAEKGAPVALELREGGWFKLPSFVAGPHPNSLRAWVKRGNTSDS